METQKTEKMILVVLAIVMLVVSFVSEFYIVGLDPFALISSQKFMAISLYVLPLVLPFFAFVKKYSVRRILSSLLLIIYVIALVQLLTFFKTGEPEPSFLRNDILSNSSINFSRNSDFGTVLAHHQGSVQNSNTLVSSELYLLDIYHKSLYPISTTDPIADNRVLFSSDGKKILYGFGKPSIATKNIGLKVFDIGSTQSNEITTSANGYDFATASKYYNWYQDDKPYLYGWLDENRIEFSCTKESDKMKAGINVDQDMEDNFVYCIYNINTREITTTKSIPKFFDGNLAFSFPYGTDTYSVPNSSDKVRIKPILNGFDGSTATEVYLVDQNGNEKLLYKGQRFDSSGIFVTSKGDLLIKKGAELIKIN